MQDYNLKPCPFCGSEAAYRHYASGDLDAFAYYCPKCLRVQQMAKTPLRAAEKWNRRAPEWFSVDKVLPSKGMYVLGFDEKEHCNYNNLYFHPDTQEFCDEMYFGKPVSITHWMAYPDAPKEDCDDE